MNCSNCSNSSNKYDVNHLIQLQEELGEVTYRVLTDESNFSTTVKYHYNPDKKYSNEKLKEIIDNLHQLLQKKRNFDALRTGYSFAYRPAPENEKLYFHNLNWKFPKV